MKFSDVTPNLIVSDIEPAAFKTWLAECNPAPHLLSVGRHIDVYKDEGHPTEIAGRYRFTELAGRPLWFDEQLQLKDLGKPLLDIVLQRPPQRVMGMNPPRLRGASGVPHGGNRAKGWMCFLSVGDAGRNAGGE